MEAKLQELNQHSLGYYLDIALRRMVAEVNMLLKEEGVNIQHSQFSLLLYLEKNEGISQSDLAGLAGKNPAAVFRSINYLESKQYVVRRAKSGCENMISLTDKGRNILPALNRIAEEVTDRALSGFTVNEKVLLLNMLNRVGNNFQR